MTEFERTLVRSFNRFFEDNRIRAVAHRIKQHRFTPQYLDVLVDSLNPDYYLGIECKSISTDKGAGALYFSQHFTTDKNGIHQVERISDYIARSGRNGFLAVELRHGAGRKRTAHAIPWGDIEERYGCGDLKYSVCEIQEYPEIKRSGNNYVIDPECWRKQTKAEDVSGE
jgi:hypothetical protein